MYSGLDGFGGCYINFFRWSFGLSYGWIGIFENFGLMDFKEMLFACY